VGQAGARDSEAVSEAGEAAAVGVEVAVGLVEAAAPGAAAVAKDSAALVLRIDLARFREDLSQRCTTPHCNTGLPVEKRGC